MPSTPQPTATPTPSANRSRSLTIALYVNAALVAAVLLVLLGRGGRMPFESLAFAQPSPQPIAGGAGFYVMPAQFDRDHWGCYVMDVDAQTLIAYQYNSRGPSGQPNLQLVAARTFQYDRQLTDYNTLPRPADVKQMADLARQGVLTDAPTNPDATTRPTVPNDPN